MQNRIRRSNGVVIQKKTYAPNPLAYKGEWEPVDHDVYVKSDDKRALVTDGRDIWIDTISFDEYGYGYFTNTDKDHYNQLWYSAFPKLPSLED